VALAAVAFLSCAAVVHAQLPFSDNFDANTALNGNFVSGHNGWYLPASGGRDFKYYAYGSDALDTACGVGHTRTIPAGFGGGGALFISGNSALAVLGRAQHTGMPFNNGISNSSGIVTIQWDLLIGLCNAATNNLASVSTQGDNNGTDVEGMIY